MPPLRLRLTLPLAGLLLACVSPVPASAATQRLSPGGSFADAYQRASSGDVVEVAAGDYRAQAVPHGSKAVTFRGAAGVRLRELDNFADNVTFDHIDVDGGFAKNNTFENHDAANVTYKNSSIGNVTDEKGALVSGDHFTFDNMVFHDAILRTDGTHMECVYAIGVPHMTVRNSTFHRCAIMDLFFTYGDWWTPKPPPYGDVTLENNVFEHSTMENGGGWHYYGLLVGNTGPDGSGMRSWVVRNNTFENAVGAGDGITASDTRWVGNIGSWDCVKGVTYSHNVGDRCSSTDRAVSPPSSSATRTAPFGWTDPGALDFTLKPGSPAVDAADPSDAPATDRAGRPRDAAPDAGAYEYGAGDSAPSARRPAAAALRFSSARLRPATICRSARRGCPSATTLRIALPQTARVTARVERVLAGGRTQRTRTVRFTAGRRGSTRIRARGLQPGRYRVVLGATAASGAKAAPKVLTLRVR